MSAPTVVAADAAGYGRPSIGSLTSAEVMRLRSRRLVKLVLAGGFLLLVLISVIVALNTGTPTAADRQQAQQQAALDEASCRQAVAASPKGDVGGDIGEICDTGDGSQYLTKSPFDLATSYKGGVIGIAVGAAALMFIIGASAGGAEWSAKTMPALLYWEPRRLRVMAVKVSVLAALALLVSIVGQVLWWLLAHGLQALNGSDPAIPLPDGFWSLVGGVVARGLLLAVLVAIGAFALANLTRNTGAALGVGFVYFAVVENVVRLFLPRFWRWLLLDNVGALLVPAGNAVPTGASSSASVGGSSTSGGDVVDQVITLSPLRGGLLLTAVVVVVLTVATVLFSRRDIT